jgi:hypothetical protein
MEGKSISGNSFILPPRGIVWVISKETFRLPGDITGLATLRTTWTHQGILALNLGIIDPGWNDHLATAVVNFSKSNFEITKGVPFFRVLFLTHKDTNSVQQGGSSGAYIERIKTNTRHFSNTFLTMDSLIVEVAEKVLGFPRWGVRIGLIAIIVAVISILAPMAFTMISQNYVMPSRVEALEKLPGRIDALEKQVNALQKINSASAENTETQLESNLPYVGRANVDSGTTISHIQNK